MSENGSNKDAPIRKRVSLVWQYFEKLSSVRVKCRICQHEQRYMGNTANALRHLKAKHDIDARPVGLQDPDNVKRMKALNVSVDLPFDHSFGEVSIKNECRYDNDDDVNRDHNDEDEVFQPEMKHNSHHRQQQISYYETETDIDPYVQNDEPLLDYVETTTNLRNISRDEAESLNFKRYSKQSITKRKKASLEDERILAETDYFREKAAYFRVQKHLAALQAKKIKYELEQMCTK